VIYDRAEWHFKGDYPDDLPPQHGGTHIGIFFAWLVSQGLESEQLALVYSDELAAIRARHLSGREFLAKRRDGQLAEGDLNTVGNAFARSYYDSEVYFKDYAEVLVRELPSLYHVDDTWENYDVMAARIDQRFAVWQKQRRPWWRFWS